MEAVFSPDCYGIYSLGAVFIFGNFEVKDSVRPEGFSELRNRILQGGSYGAMADKEICHDLTIRKPIIAF